MFGSGARRCSDRWSNCWSRQVPGTQDERPGLGMTSRVRPWRGTFAESDANVHLCHSRSPAAPRLTGPYLAEQFVPRLNCEGGREVDGQLLGRSLDVRQPAFAPGQDERGPALTRPSVSKAP